MTQTLPTAPADLRRWPDVAAVPHAGLRARIAAALARRTAARLPLRIVLPDGSDLGNTGAADRAMPALRLHRPDAFFRRLGARGLIGFGESYQAGDWDSDDLVGLLTVLACDVATLVPPLLQRLRRIYTDAQPTTDDGSVGNARHNIARHYDLSNDMFALFLDETMTYSSALFAPGDSLTAAQHRKIDRLLDRAEVGPGTRLLEIGTGWGELAVRAARRGATVHTITLSEQQRRHAVDYARRAGVGRQVRVELRDFRQLTGARAYDAVVSVEMIEAVGERYWPEYFGVLARMLAPGGRVGLQSITMPHARLLASRHSHTWIQKYIFPGGLIPSVQVVGDQAGEAGLRIVDRFAFGADYARTLSLWRERFEQRWEQVAALGFDDTFRRTWRLYLAYSEAGFASGYLDVHQFTMEVAP
ncbi:cyclopropane-fatty-acyl-phospholipid synthase family protein [Catellatospora citrea]|uniref:cyclopropane-fatty-acyl-phospholipid synthase family protein n=1 Tax=Catellatospora citrea TaxID=53366 RepID=UPI0033F558D8